MRNYWNTKRREYKINENFFQWWREDKMDGEEESWEILFKISSTLSLKRVMCILWEFYMRILYENYKYFIFYMRIHKISSFFGKFKISDI